MMIQMVIQKLAHPLNNDEGSNAIEYGLIAGLVSVAIVAALNGIAGALIAAFGNVVAAF